MNWNGLLNELKNIRDIPEGGRMTKLQAKLTGAGILVAGIGIALTGAFLKNDALTVFGSTLTFAGLTALGIPRPQDASA